MGNGAFGTSRIRNIAAIMNFYIHIDYGIYILECRNGEWRIAWIMNSLFWNIAMRGQSGTYHGPTHEGRTTLSRTVFRGCGGWGRARLPTCDLLYSVNLLGGCGGRGRARLPTCDLSPGLHGPRRVRSRRSVDRDRTRIKDQDQERVHKEAYKKLLG